MAGDHRDPSSTLSLTQLHPGEAWRMYPAALSPGMPILTRQGLREVEQVPDRGGYSLLWVLLAHSSSPPQSFRTAALSNIIWSSQFCLICELDTKASSSRLWTKTSKGTDPRSDPWCFLTSLLVGHVLLTATLCDWSSNWFLLNLAAHPSRPWHPHLDARKLWDMVMKALLKLR